MGLALDEPKDEDYSEDVDGVTFLLDEELEDYLGDRMVKVESHPIMGGLSVRLAGARAC